ncbi:MAG: rod shape-determining protein RodA [Elusimicrobiaceae bacterium]|jgi:rod shape determining protein RodA|nr:rod shape-determining protein RodA [Elusimicrobiaceae bacterium]MBT6715305.1 rod shape-determining protein RodA [Elusimicrobiaceae bacterium]MBT7283092.1 rod shape-determining protein RodA [Elusimicrobiaceae bacterium]
MKPLNLGIKRTTLDITLLAVFVSLVLIGTMAIMSAVSGTSFAEQILRTHFVAIILAVIVFILSWSLNYQVFSDQWKVLYGIMILTLIAVLIIGVSDRGSRSWFRLPFFSIQPSELCRVGLIMVMASFLHFNYRRIADPQVIIKVCALILPMFALVMMQPDFSWVVITFPTIFAMLYASGVNMFYLIIICGYAGISGLFPIMWTLFDLKPDLLDYRVFSFLDGLSNFGWNTFIFCGAAIVLGYLVWYSLRQLRIMAPTFYVLLAVTVLLAGFFSGVFIDKQIKNYQRKRVEAFLEPTSDPKGAGYNVIQSKIAIGSGGFVGKGLFSGTQARLGFVPERHTDFILAVVGEEMGFMGMLAVLLLYLIMLYRVYSVALVSSDMFGFLVCCGVFSMFLVYLVVNFGMIVGLLPVAGIPLPLISYGGSNLVSSVWALGLVESIYARRITVV